MHTKSAATKAISNWMEAHMEEFDTIYDKLVHIRDTIAKKMGYENYVQFGYYIITPDKCGIFK